MEQLISHEDEDHFIINMFGLHNATLLRCALPRALIAPSALHSDRHGHHKELAAKLRIAQSTKRKRTQEKRMATAATNKAKKVARQAEIDAEREAQELLAQEDDIDEGSDEDNISDDDLEGLIVRPTKRPRIRILNQ